MPSRKIGTSPGKAGQKMAEESTAIILDVKLLDFRKDGDCYKFRVKGGDYFYEAISELKHRMPFKERRWVEEKKQWEVLITPGNERALAIFENGASCIEIIKSQLRLF